MRLARDGKRGKAAFGRPLGPQPHVSWHILAGNTSWEGVSLTARFQSQHMFIWSSCETRILISRLVRRGG